MKDTLYVVGHRNPDTDSIASAIAYAELKRRLGHEAVPCRLGDLNPETAHVLKTFGFPEPLLLETVRPRVEDLDLDPPIPVSPECSLKVAWNLMKRHGAKTLPVVDDHERLLGVATLSDLTERYMDSLDAGGLAAGQTPWTNLVETLNARVERGDRGGRVEGKVVVAAMTPDRMGEFVEPRDLVLVGNRRENQLRALELGASCLVVTGGGDVEPEVRSAAEAAGCRVLVAPCDTFTAARLVNLSLPVRHVMTSRELVVFDLDDFVDDIRDAMLRTRYRSYPVVDSRNRVQGFVARYHLISRKRKKVVLVDHNERAQSVPGIEEAEVLEILDHHRVGDIQTGSPILFRNEPLGSTATLVCSLYEENGLRPTGPVAGLLCAAVLSDTLRFKSPTSTPLDRMAAERMGEMAGIRDLDAFAAELFRAASSLEGKKPEDLLQQDLKEYALGDWSAAVGQLVVAESALSPSLREELARAMEDLCGRRGYGLVALMLTDPLDESSRVLAAGEQRDLLFRAFGQTPSPEGVRLPGVMSRKKQLLPALVRALEEE